MVTKEQAMADEIRRCSICRVTVAIINGPWHSSRITFLANAALPMGKQYRCKEHAEGKGVN